MLHRVRYGRHERDGGSRDRVDDAYGVWSDPACHDEEATCARHEVVVGEAWELSADGASRGGVEEEAAGGKGVTPLWELLVQQDPLPEEEARVRRIGPRAVGCVTPAAADGAHVHVEVEVASGEETVADFDDEVVRERGPARHCSAYVVDGERCVVCVYCLVEASLVYAWGFAAMELGVDDAMGCRRWSAYVVV